MRGGPTPCGCTSSERPSRTTSKLFHEPDERYWVGAGFTRSERYLVIGIGSSITSEEWLVDADDLRSEPRVVWPRVEGVEYDSSHAIVDGEDVLFILHNDGALDFELVRVAASDPAGARQTVIPHRAGERLLGVSDVPRLGGRRLPPRRPAAHRDARLRRRRGV